MEDGRIIFIKTLFSCLATMSASHNFKLYWKPPFISKLAAEDRCHLNGMAMRDGKPSHITGVSRRQIVNSWRDRWAEGGCLIDVATNKIVTEKLSMPHSPHWVWRQAVPIFAIVLSGGFVVVVLALFFCSSP